MIWQLLKLDPAWRWTPYATGILAVCFALSGVFGGDAGRFVVTQVLVVPLILAASAVTAQISDSRFYVPLPVSVRSLFVSRVLSLAALLWFPAAAGAAVLFATNHSGWRSLPWVIWFPFTAALLCLQSPAARGLHIPKMAMPGLSALAVGFISVSSVNRPNVGTPPWEIWVAGLSTVVAAAFIWTSWRSLPLAIESVPATLSPTISIAAPAPSLHPWLTIWRALPLNGLFHIPAIALLMLISYRMPLMLIMLAGQWTFILRPAKYWLSSLPVPRRLLLALTVVPPAVALAGGYLLGVHLHVIPGGGVVQVQPQQEPPGRLNSRIGQDCATYNVLPPTEYWLPARSGRAPVIQSPWGETFQPPLIKTLGAPIYNPFAVGCANTTQFLDWQFERATTLVYGHPVERNARQGSSAVEGLDALIPARTQFVNVFLLVAISLLCNLYAFMLDWRILHRLSTRPRRIVVAVTGAVVFVPYMFAISSQPDSFLLASYFLPDSLPAAVTLASLVILFLFALAAKLHTQTEFADKPARAAVGR